MWGGYMNVACSSREAIFDVSKIIHENDILNIKPPINIPNSLSLRLWQKFIVSCVVLTIFIIWNG